MPIYEYRCDDCSATFEVFQKFSDAPVATCERCGGPVHRVLHPVAIHFKGSGFYTTDYGRKSSFRTASEKGEAGEAAATSAADDAAGGASGTAATARGGERQSAADKAGKSRDNKAVAGDRAG